MIGGTRVPVSGAQPSDVRPVTAPGWIGLARLHPLHSDRRFWATVALLAVVEAAHDATEALPVLRESVIATEVPHDFIMFVIPVIYAALNFGLRGALVTAAASTLLTLPNWVFLHAGGERIGEVGQMAVVFAVAAFVGSRVDREVAARAMAEQSLSAFHAAETQYQVLFETAGNAILLVHASGVVERCNDAASVLLGRDPARVVGRELSDALPRELASALAGCVGGQHDLAEASSSRPSGPDCTEVLLAGPDGHETWVQPVCTAVPGSQSLTQVVLLDVTWQKRREGQLADYAAQVLQTQEEERRRIAQELHDDTLQSLVLLYRRLDAAEGESGAVPASTSRQLQELRGDIETMMETLRALVRGLRPAALEDLGLTAALRRLTTEFADRSETEVELVTDGDLPRLPGDVELALYRIAQEALRNAERHSGASRAVVTVSVRGHETELTVADNGEGFVWDGARGAEPGEGTLGLLGMQERARLVGGALKIESAPGEGTTVVATVPAASPDG